MEEAKAGEWPLDRLGNLNADAGPVVSKPESTAGATDGGQVEGAHTTTQGVADHASGRVQSLHGQEEGC